MNATKIEYVDVSWNPVTGCSDELPCWDYCWARDYAETRLRGRFDYDQDDPFRPTYHPDRLGEPAKLRKPRRIAVCFMGDLWHRDIPDDWIREVVLACQAAPQHTYLFLTKRPLRFLNGFNFRVHPNWWLGTSCDDQATADERIPQLLRCRAARHWISVEPMRGPINLHGFTVAGSPDWLALGGGPFPVYPQWVRDVRDQCRAAGVPFFFKQWGDWLHWSAREIVDRCQPRNEKGWAIGYPDHRCHEWSDKTQSYRIGKKAAGRMLDGREWTEIPE